MSSPAERSSESSSSKYNNKSPPLYHSTDRFNPLGFSTPQQQQRGHASQARNYYSAQPKYMLPRPRGFHNRQRHGQNEYHDRSHTSTVKESCNDDSESQGNMNAESNRQYFHRNWRGHHNRNQRFGGQRQQHNFRPKHQVRCASYNIDDYFHPSMLEDPWEFLLRNFESSSERMERSIARDIMPDEKGNAGDSSNSADED